LYLLSNYQRKSILQRIYLECKQIKKNIQGNQDQFLFFTKKSHDIMRAKKEKQNIYIYKFFIFFIVLKINSL